MAARTYRLTVEGELSDIAAQAFEGMTLTRGAGTTLLVGSTTEAFHGTPDQAVRVEFDQSHLYLFDRDTQNSL